jgi:cell wall-associated NlpC family hydrolase
VTPSGPGLAKAAEALIGIPFRFRGRDPRTGLDCVGLVIAALRSLDVSVPAMAPYAMRQRDFAAQFGCAGDAGFVEVRDRPKPGDLLLVRPGPAQVHLAIVGPDGALVHAHAGLGRVVATPPPCPWPVERHWRLRDH